jgi:hypothetical protein
MKEFILTGDNITFAMTREDNTLFGQLRRMDGSYAAPIVPLMELEIYSKAEFRTEHVREYRVDLIEEAECGLHVVIGNAQWGLRIGLWFKVEDGELVVRMPIVEVYEDRIDTRRLFGVILLPGLMTAGKTGEMFLPLNSGCLSYPADKPALRDRFMIYGEQPRWELMPTLPICGVHNPTGGMMAMATGAAAEMECHVATDGQGNGQVALCMTLRQSWPDPVEWETREIRYRFIDAKADFLQAIAKRLRRHVIEDMGKLTLKQRFSKSPELEYLLHGYIMKLFYAVENCGIMMAGARKGDPLTFKQVMTFVEAEQGLRRLKAAGVNKIYTQSVGFNANGHDGLFPSFFPIEERLGGETGFRKLIAAGHEMGFQMNVHDNKKGAVRRSPEFSEDEVVWDQWGPMGLGEWGGGVTHVINNQLKTDQQLDAWLGQLKALGLQGMGYLDGMANPLYRNYHPRHRFGRTTYAKMTNRLIESSRRVHGAAGTECGFMYATVAADSICTGGSPWHWDLCWDEWPITHLMDKRVPLYRLVFGGLVFHECQALSWQGVMECVLLGKHPRDEWAVHPGVMPILTDERIAKIKAVYDVALVRFGHLQAEEIMTWKQEGDIQITTYADGTEVTADFANGLLKVNGEIIECPDALG